MEFLLECEPPENRVRAWLEHLNATQEESEESEFHAPETNKSTFSESTSIVESATQTTNRSKYLKDINNKFSLSGSDSGWRSSATYRRPYDFEECNAIVKYIINNDVFPFIKGNTLWKKMELDEVCHRSWQSMKSHFLKKIYPNLGTYSLNKDDKEKFIKYMKPSISKKSISLKPGKRGWRRNGCYYSVSEDKIIINYILQKQRYLLVLGNSMWQTMADKKILPDRSWQSMRSRYLNFIMCDLQQYKLKESDVRKLRSVRKNGAKGQNNSQKSQNTPQSSHCSNMKGDFTNMKKKQDIRWHALYASAQLATNLRTSKTTAVQNCEKESNNVLQKEENLCSVTKSFAENNIMKKNSKNNTIECCNNIAEHAIPNTKQILVDSLKKGETSVPNVSDGKICDHTEYVNSCHNCDVTNLDEVIGEIQITPKSARFTCTKDSFKSALSNCECSKCRFHLGEPSEATDSQVVTDKDISVEEDFVERTCANNDMDLSSEIINNLHAQDIIDINSKEQNRICNTEKPSGESAESEKCSNTEKSSGESEKIYEPENNVLCENIVLNPDLLEISSVSEKHSISSKSTILHIGTRNMQSRNECTTLQRSSHHEEEDDYNNDNGDDHNEDDDEDDEGITSPYSCIAIKNCEKCSADHKLSPSSN